jgi:hypothetical protein
MSKNNKYLFLSVPSTITPSGHKDDAIQTLQKAVNESYGTVLPFPIPEFKIGTLDALIQQSEDLAKLEGMCQGVVSKVGDTLKNILDGDEEKMAQHKSVNDSVFPALQVGPTALHRRGLLMQSARSQNLSINTFGPSPGTKSSTGQIDL